MRACDILRSKMVLPLYAAAFSLSLDSLCHRLVRQHILTCCIHKMWATNLGACLLCFPVFSPLGKKIKISTVCVCLNELGRMCVCGFQYKAHPISWCFNCIAPTQSHALAYKQNGVCHLCHQSRFILAVSINAFYR